MAARSKELAKLQQKELDRGLFDVADSFHGDFRECRWIIVRNLSYQLSEGDVATVFEQYGTITSMEPLRDKDTGRSRGTAIVAYDDPRSAVLAVDNFNAMTLLGRQISVEHIAFEPRPDSNLVDPRTKIPARLRSDKAAAAKPAFDPGSASSTDED
jgi:RNA-binding motif X-linked protein 2